MKPEQREELKQAAMRLQAARDAPRHIFNARQDEYRDLAPSFAILSLIAQVEALTVPQWISVETALPPVGQEVIVYCPNKDNVHRRVTALTRLIRYEGANEFYWDNDYGGSNIHLQGSVAYWMPKPDAPTIPAIPGTKEGA